MTKTALGIDIGGTKVSLVLGTASGRILSRRMIPTRTGRATQRCIEEMLENTASLLEEARKKKLKVEGVGIGIPGAVDSVKGTVPRSPHLEGWMGIPLARIFNRRFRLPVVMANDANAAAIAEKVFGQAKDCEHFIYMTVSTGVGGGIVTHGRLLEGASFVAGEVGHMTIEKDGEPWKLNEIGCLEAYASGTAIARYVRRELKKGRKSVLLEDLEASREVTAKEISAAAKKGDSLAVEAFRRAGEYLGIGVGNLLNILNPSMVIFGGGVLKSAPAVFWETMLKSCKRRSWPEAFRAAKITRSRIKGSIGDLGALALVFESALQKKTSRKSPVRKTRLQRKSYR